MLSNKIMVDLRAVTARHLARGARKPPASTMLTWWPLSWTARLIAKILSVLPEIHIISVGISSNGRPRMEALRVLLLQTGYEEDLLPTIHDQVGSSPSPPDVLICLIVCSG